METTETDILVIAIYTSHQDPDFMVKNQLPDSKRSPIFNKVKRIGPDEVPTPAVELKLKSDFVTALFDPQVQKSNVIPTIACKFRIASMNNPPPPPPDI